PTLRGEELRQHTAPTPLSARREPRTTTPRPPRGGGGGGRGRLSPLLERLLEESDDEETRELLRASAASYELAWQSHFSREHDPMRILGECNLFRYRACRGVLVRAETASADGPLALPQAPLP